MKSAAIVLCFVVSLAIMIFSHWFYRNKVASKIGVDPSFDPNQLPSRQRRKKNLYVDTYATMLDYEGKRTWEYYFARWFSLMNGLPFVFLAVALFLYASDHELFAF